MVLKNGIKLSVGQAVYCIIDQNIILTVLIHNLTTTWSGLGFFIFFFNLI